MVKICLIDDDQNILASLSLALKSEKFDVETYSDGISGLEALKSNNFDSNFKLLNENPTNLSQ